MTPQSTSAALDTQPLQHPGGEYFFFGPPDRQLFASFHQPDTDIVRDTAVLLCYPWGQEYLASHRAYLQLALAIASQGYPVLRFDYAGTGDSSGPAEWCSLTSWREDVSAAARELRNRAGVDLLCLGGLRLGGALAALAAAEEQDISGLILWQPVVNGPRYLEDIRQRHQAMLWRSFATLPAASDANASLYQLGFPLSDSFLAELQALDLLSIATPPCPVAVFDNEEDEATIRLQDRLRSRGGQVDRELIPSFAIWHEDVDKGLVPRQTIDRIATWLRTHCP